MAKPDLGALLLIKGKKRSHDEGDDMDEGDDEEGEDYRKMARDALSTAFDAAKDGDREGFIDAMKGAIEYCVMDYEGTE